MDRRFGFGKSPFLVMSCLALAWGVVSPPAIAQTPESQIAQNAITDPPAHVSFVDGTALLERDGQQDSSPTNMPLLAGDRLRTQNGRLEILFADGSTLHMDSGTTLDFQSDELVRLLDGRIRLAIPGPDRQVSYRIDAPSASALINQPGEYRVSVLHGAQDGDIELAVLRGGAELVNDDGRTALRAGQRAFVRANAAPSYAYAFNSASWDSFDRWSEGRRDQRLGVSTQYLPSEVRSYSPAFDQYGSWQYDTSYGYVWYPSVAVGWRPYYYGRWVTLRPYGWTWVGADPWAWPTHHYGRWGFSASRWFWIPGRSWGPAWVSWAYAPGYVSWCPLGWNNRAVLQFGFNFGYDPWRAWTVVPYRSFGTGYVNAHYVAGRAFDVRTRSAFVPRYTAPSWSGYAVPRSTSPIRVAGTARPRGGAPTVYTNLEPGASRVGQGGQRVIVGQPRSTLADTPAGPASTDRSRAVARGVPADQSTGGASAAPRTDAPVRADRSANASRQAVPRDDSSSRSALPSQRYGAGVDRNQAGSPRLGDTPSYRESPYGRRSTDALESSPRPNGVEQRARPVAPDYQPYGARTPETARPRGPDTPAYGNVPRSAPESARPAQPDRSYGSGGDRRAPAAERPSGPPPESARPAPREYRANPGADRGAPPQDNRGNGSSSGQGHSRGGQQSGGTAVPRGRR